LCCVKTELVLLERGGNEGYRERGTIGAGAAAEVAESWEGIEAFSGAVHVGSGFHPQEKDRAEGKLWFPFRTVASGECHGGAS
jgi:hypothetical protein